MPFPVPVSTYHHDVYPAIDPTNPLNSQCGKIVLITGAGTGIGKALALAFAAAEAAHIALLGRTVATIEETAAAVSAAGGVSKAHVFVADVTDEARMEAVFGEVHSKLGPLDVVVANAGYLEIGPFMDIKADSLRRCFEANVIGTFVTAQAFMRHKNDAAQPGPTLVAISSAVAHLGYYRPNVPYSTSKTAAARVVEMLQGEYPEIRAFNLHPGVVPTPMSAKAKSSYPAEDTPELSAAAAVWLATPAADWLKGRFLWAHWDVVEMEKEQKEKVQQDPNYLHIGLMGWPFEGKTAKAPWDNA